MQIFIFNKRECRDIFDMNFKNHHTDICRHGYFHILAWPLQRSPLYRSVLEWGTLFYVKTDASNMFSKPTWYEGNNKEPSWPWNASRKHGGNEQIIFLNAWKPQRIFLSYLIQVLQVPSHKRPLPLHPLSKFFFDPVSRPSAIISISNRYR